MAQLVEGMKVRYLPQPEWGVGHLVSLIDDGARAQVEFPGREGGPTLVSTKGGQLAPHQLSVGDPVRTSKGRLGKITGEEPGGRGLRRYTLRYDDGGDDELPESEVRGVPQSPDLITLLRAGRVGDGRGFLLRKRALSLDDERRCDALGALFASRVMIKPHQISVVQRVLASRRPRFILADEVGLGKTIEAGMIFSALRLSGLGKRVLVVAPAHLTIQWLVELFHKFNQLFTLLDADRHASSLREQPETSPWVRFDKVVTSLEMLSRADAHRVAAGDPRAFWDLVIIDEAHHLKGEKAFEAATALAKNAWGLLLLTATPMQLDPEEYHRLLTLIDPSTAPSLEQFRSRLARQEEISEAVRELSQAGGSRARLKAVASKFPDDEVLGRIEESSAALAHLARTYSLSEHLIRNRRATVGGFAARVLRRHPAPLSEAGKALRASALEALTSSSKLKGAALADLLRRLESSPAAMVASAANLPALAGLRWPSRDEKLKAFEQALEDIWSKEPSAKILVFTEAKETLEMLKAELAKGGIEALNYHGDLPLLERDRQVARFRDPDGPKVLLCTEVGGEGRNFQFSHHLINYDLPWSPAAMEQRIGRLDRIGQTHPVEIHVFDQPGTLSGDVLDLLERAVGVFREPIGGLDAVLEEVEPKLSELALMSSQARAGYAAELQKAVEQARQVVQRSYDPLLDRRSHDPAVVGELVQRALHRMRIDLDGEDEGLEPALWAISRDLDERLEETVTELARKVGLGVDTDEEVEAFQCAFRFGHELKVEALPGLNIAEEKVVVGSFWRDTAVDKEEIDYFATGHPLVEALFGFLRDGPFGRSGMRAIDQRQAPKARGLELLYHLVLPDPEDTSVGAKVPSRLVSRFLERMLIRVAVVESADGPKADQGLLPVLDQEGRVLNGDQAARAFPSLAQFASSALALGERTAQDQVGILVARASELLDAEKVEGVERLRLALTYQGLSPDRVAAQLFAEKAHYQSLHDALARAKPVLDSACPFVLNVR